MESLTLVCRLRLSVSGVDQGCGARSYLPNVLAGGTSPNEAILRIEDFIMVFEGLKPSRLKRRSTFEGN